jgi:hypothetical protein
MTNLALKLDQGKLQVQVASSAIRWGNFKRILFLATMKLLDRLKLHSLNF